MEYYLGEQPEAQTFYQQYGHAYDVLPTPIAAYTQEGELLYINSSGRSTTPYPHQLTLPGEFNADLASAGSALLPGANGTPAMRLSQAGEYLIATIETSQTENGHFTPESARELIRLAEALSIPVAYIALDGQIIVANQSALQQMGYPDANEGHHNVFAMIDHRNGDQVQDGFRQIGDGQGIIAPHILIVHGETGATIPFLIYAEPVYNGSEVIGMIATLVNQTPIEEATHAEAMRHYADVLRQHTNDLMAAVSHELRTPLSNLKTRLYLLKNTPLPDAAQIHIAVLEETVKTMTRITDQLLKMVELEAELAIGITRERLDITEMCNDLARAHYVDFVKPENNPVILASPRHVSMAVTALLINANFFTPQGEGRRRPVLQILTTDREVIIEIEDNGQGIPEEAQDRVFEKFFTADTSRNRGTGGLGLGLPTVRAIAEAHGGTVSFQSTPGEGSTFRIHLPIVE